jgi:hypothetical protein
MRKYEVIKKFRNFELGKRQKSRQMRDLKELSSLNPFKDYEVTYPQWAGHRYGPKRCRGVDNKLYDPVFVSETVAWTSWEYGDRFVVYTY